MEHLGVKNDPPPTADANSVEPQIGLIVPPRMQELNLAVEDRLGLFNLVIRQDELQNSRLDSLTGTPSTQE
jgi:hypothetical protein